MLLCLVQFRTKLCRKVPIAIPFYCTGQDINSQCLRQFLKRAKKLNAMIIIVKKVFKFVSKMFLSDNRLNVIKVKPDIREHLLCYFFCNNKKLALFSSATNV